MKIEKFIKLLFAAVVAYVALLSVLLFWAYMGFVFPQIAISNLFYNGYGVPKNHKFAFYWYQRAAENSKEGKYLLGTAYYEGIGVDVNYEKAIPLIKESAEAGNSQAQLVLGHMLSQSKFKSYSYYYYSLAKKQGVESAASSLKSVEKNMTQGEIDFAKELLKNKF